MQGITLTVIIIASVFVLLLRPTYALAALIASLLYYPYYLAVSIGTVDILVGRMVVGVLFMRCMLDSRIRKNFVWSRLDTWVAVSMFIYVIVALIYFSMPFMRRVENRGGFVMDTFLAYLVARFIITDRSRLISLVKCVSFLLIPLAILGLVECLTGWQFFERFWPYCPWYSEGTTLPQRWGLTRAVGPFGHPILFGGNFAMFLPLIYYLHNEGGPWKRRAYILSGIALVGALSSMSSGPWVMAIIVIICLALEKRKYLVKPFMIFFVFSCIFTQITSDREFYHVIVSYANPLGGAGWHRAKLIDLAIEHFGEWWLTGYRNLDPGWGRYLGMGHTDVTNEFILVGIRYGVFGMLALIIVLIMAFQMITYRYRKTTDPKCKSIIWALGSILFSVTVTWMSVSFFGQLATIFYIIFGIISSAVQSSFDWQERNRILLVKNYTV
jgi:hypothetical protein